MEEKFTAKAKIVLEEAHNIALEFQHSYIGTEHLLAGLLKVEDTASFLMLKKHGMELEKMLNMIDYHMNHVGIVAVHDRDAFTPRAREVIEESRKIANILQEELIGTEHILIALLREPESVAYRLIGTMQVSVKKLYMDVLQAVGVDPAKFEAIYAGNAGNNNGSQARRGNKSALRQFSTDLTKQALEGKLDPVIGRESEITRVIQIMSRRTKNNPCLVGEPGVGKTAIVEAIADRIAHGNVPNTLQGKRLMTLDLAAMVAGSKYRGEFEERIKSLIAEVKEAGDVLLFLDEIHTVIGAGSGEGTMDAANILKPALARGEIQLIGATTLNEYRKYFEKDAALERRFQPVTVEQVTEEQAIDILRGIKHKYEAYHEVDISDEAVTSAVKMSARYINDRFLPDKAIDVLDEACAKVKLQIPVGESKTSELERQITCLENEKIEAIKLMKLKRIPELTKQQQLLRAKLEKITSTESGKKKTTSIVKEEDIASVIALWTKIPVAKLTEKESTRLKKLNQILAKRVVGQKEAVDAVSNAVRRGRVGLKDPRRPIGSFLFLGPAGVGKTELSKALAEAVFGSENAIIRVDMSEYMEKHSVSKMVGSPPGYVGYEDGGQLSEQVRRHTYSVILFDEIEKAHPDVFNILLQVLDEGHITDNTGRKIDFKNTIIIMTSNAGAQRIIEPKLLGFNSVSDEEVNHDKMKNNVMEEVKKLFKPEFLNRIDDIIVFRALLKEDMKQIVTIMLKDVINRAKEYMNIDLVVTSAAKSCIVDESFDKKYGARPLRRKIQSAIEDQLAEKILDGTVTSGCKITVGVKNKKIDFVTEKI